MKTILLIILCFCSCAAAGQFSVAWDAHPDATVREFRIYRIDGPARVLLASPAASPATITANPGDIIAVSAFNGAESGLSAFVTIPAAPVPPTGLRVVEIQTSSNLKDWQTIAFVPVTGTGFVRAKTSTITQP